MLADDAADGGEHRADDDRQKRIEVSEEIKSVLAHVSPLLTETPKINPYTVRLKSYSAGPTRGATGANFSGRATMEKSQTPFPVAPLQ